MRSYRVLLRRAQAVVELYGSAKAHMLVHHPDRIIRRNTTECNVLTGFSEDQSGLRYVTMPGNRLLLRVTEDTEQAGLEEVK